MDAFLASLPAGTVERQFEYYKLEPWGDDWERSSMIAAQLTNMVRCLASGFGGRSLEEKDLLPPDVFVPHRETADAEGEQLAASLKALKQLEGI